MNFQNDHFLDFFYSHTFQGVSNKNDRVIFNLHAYIIRKIKNLADGRHRYEQFCVGVNGRQGLVFGFQFGLQVRRLVLVAVRRRGQVGQRKLAHVF